MLAKYELGSLQALRQSAPYSVVYILLLALSGFGTLRGVERFRRPSLTLGTHLLPLDVVTVDEFGVTVRPLGSLTRAAVDEGQGELVLTFADGHVERFACGTAARAETAYQTLESAQESLERLTHQPNVREALDLDPFFSLRSETTWHELAPSAPQGERLRWRPRLADSLLVVGATALGSVLVPLRNRASDDVAFARAQSSLAALRTYVRVGGRHGVEARQAIARLEAAEERERQLEGEQAPFFAAANAVQDKLVASRVAYARLRPKSNYVAQCIGDAIERGGVRLTYQTDVARTDLAAPLESAGLYYREEALLTAFQDVFGKTIDGSRIEWRRADRGQDANLRIKTRVRVGKDPLDVTYTFDVTLAFPECETVEHAPKPFRLTMPAPKADPALRAESLFSKSESVTERVAARAYDRLYDEVYELFFGGPIRVPHAPAKPASKT
jgi:hypothetical protein